jgi:hypothetical protein
MVRPVRTLLASFAFAALAACATPRAGEDPQLRFFESLQSLCGSAYEGRVVTDDAADRELAANRLVMHVRTCSDDEIRIPFHVGEDRSRIWVISRTEYGLRLKHDHRHRDGSEDVRSQYGGDTVAPGTARRQEFPADLFSRELFVRQEIAASVSNVWAIEIEPRRRFAYELRRPNRHFRAEFDLTRPVEPPPPPWGANAR